MAVMTQIPRRTTPIYPTTSPAKATERPNEPVARPLVSASARCPQMTAGTEVSPRVNKEKTPRTKAQSGRVGKSSFAPSKAVDIAEDEEWIITDLGRPAADVLHLNIEGYYSARRVCLSVMCYVLQEGREAERRKFKTKFEIRTYSARFWNKRSSRSLTCRFAEVI